MALKKTIQLSGNSFLVTDYGQLQLDNRDITLDCYIKVEAVSGGKDGATASALFRGESAVFTKSYEFTPDMDGPNFIKQAYLHLKTLPEFAGAVDC